MARALAIETAGRDGSVAVVDGGAVVAEESFPGGFRHVAGLLPLVDRLVRGRGWTPDHLDEVYVSAGPGSFTGLRVGIVAAKMLAEATGVRLVAVPSLSVVVANAPADADHAIVLLDAKRGQVFTARFERVADEWVEREPAQLATLAAMLARAPRPVYLLGEGITTHVAGPIDGVVVTPSDLWRPQAAVVAHLGMAMAAAGRFVAADALVPTYIRLAEAEEKWRAAQPT